YLTQEVAALGRSLDTSIFANELIDPTYVAVSAEPRLPDPQFYAGLARHSGASLRWSMATSGAPVPSIASLATVSNLSDFSDHVLSLARQALSADFPGSEEHEAKMDANLGFLLQSVRQQVVGRLYVCRGDGD